MKKFMFMLAVVASASVFSCANANDNNTSEEWLDAGVSKWTDKDYQGAIDIFQGACDKNILKGCEYVARVYADEEWTGRNLQKAKSLNKKVFAVASDGCKNGNVSNCEIAANTAANEMEAKPYYEKACSGGIYNSCSSAGSYYVDTDQKKALSYYESGCEGGNKFSCQQAGEIYYYYLGDKKTGKEFFKNGAISGIDEDAKLIRAQMFMKDLVEGQKLGADVMIRDRWDLLLDKFMKYTSGCNGIDRGLSQRSDVGPIGMKPIRLEINGQMVEATAGWAKLCTKNYNVLAEMTNRDLVTIAAYMTFSQNLKTLEKTYSAVRKNPKKLLEFLDGTVEPLNTSLAYFPLDLPINSGGADGMLRQAIERFADGDMRGFATWYKVIMDKDGYVKGANKSPFIRAVVEDYLMRHWE